ncbi:MAG TPA: SGNH/GDSL hydrolase family protein [Mycobacteriales bacterium]|nr:SGNH/GDSL hydrolase family protein [Mycobacteriales bacterium]
MTRYPSFVAVGDSFTEGLDDPRGDGTFAGWADRVAERLAHLEPDFAYANLAVRGKLLGQIVEQQVPVAAAMRPALVSLAGGTNDMLRPGFDADALGAALRTGVATLRNSGAQVVLFTGGDPSGRLPWASRLLPKVVALNDLVRAIAADLDTVLVDLWPTRVWDDVRLWSDDRLHLNTTGHARVASAVLEALGVPNDDDWRAPLPPAPPRPWHATRADDLRWARTHLAPWVGRRLRGRSSGDAVEPKRPQLTPYR